MITFASCCRVPMMMNSVFPSFNLNLSRGASTLIPDVLGAVLHGLEGGGLLSSGVGIGGVLQLCIVSSGLHIL